MKLRLKTLKPKGKDKGETTASLLERKVSSKDSSLMDALFAFDHREYACLVPYSIIEGERRSRVVYDVTSLVALEAYVNTTIDSEQFIVLVESLLRSFEQVDELGIPYDRLALDSKYVYVNSVGGAMSFIYVGSTTQKQDDHPAYNLFSLLGSVPQPKSYDDRQLMKNYSEGLADIIDQEIAGYRVFAQSFVDRYRGTVRISAGQRRATSRMVVDGAFYDARKAAEQVHSSGFPSNGITGNLRQMEGGATLAPSSDGELPVVRITWLNANRTWSVSNYPFVLGSSGQAQGCLEGSSWVSRRHAQITTDGSHVFIEDLNSTNGSLLNGRVLPPKTKAVLSDGDKISLANEELVISSGGRD